MAKIEIPDELYNKLIELSNELNNQDHRCTKMPYFIQIREPDEIWGMDSEYAHGYDWYMPGGDGQTIDPDDDEALSEELYDKGLIRTEDEEDSSLPTLEEYLKQREDEDYLDRESIVAELGYIRCYKKDVEKFSNCFFTTKAAKRYIEKNQHNLKDTADTYLFYADRNPEMEIIFQFLCGLTGKKLHQ